jgi:hypothetical protein
MTTTRDPDRLITAFLMEGAEDLPDAVYDAVRADIDSKRQRAVIGPWRMPSVNKLMPIGLGAAAVAVALVVAGRLMPAAPTSPGAAPSASTSASATPAPSDSATPTRGAPSPSVAPDLPLGSFTAAQTDGDITVTIPAGGWTYNPDYLVLSKGEDADPPEAAVLLWSFPAETSFQVPADPCKWQSTKPKTPATKAADIAAALHAQASRAASEPDDVIVGGFPGKKITLHVPTDAVFERCDGGEFVSYGVPGDAMARRHQGPGQIDELWIVDVGDSVAILDATYRPSTPQQLIAELRAIAQSATFERR